MILVGYLAGSCTYELQNMVYNSNYLNFQEEGRAIPITNKI